MFHRLKKAVHAFPWKPSSDPLSTRATHPGRHHQLNEGCEATDQRGKKYKSNYMSRCLVDSAKAV